MNLSLIFAGLWVVLAAVLAAIPSRDNHWRRAWFLVATGLPILAWVLWQNGPWWGLAVALAEASILRWPIRRLITWLRR